MCFSGGLRLIRESHAGDGAPWYVGEIGHNARMGWESEGGGRYEHEDGTGRGMALDRRDPGLRDEQVATRETTHDETAEEAPRLGGGGGKDVCDEQCGGAG